MAIRQQISLRKFGRNHTDPSPSCLMSAQGQPAARIQAQQSNNYLPACMTISVKAPCADDAASIIPFLYLLLRVHIFQCWYHCCYMTISVLFSLSLGKVPCMFASVDTTVTVWKYPFLFLYLLLMVHLSHFMQAHGH